MTPAERLGLESLTVRGEELFDNVSVGWGGGGCYDDCWAI